jgi:hypothetical protein
MRVSDYYQGSKIKKTAQLAHFEIVIFCNINNYESKIWHGKEFYGAVSVL